MLEVAVGVVFRADGAVLLGQRIPGKPYAGWWEFPGGKLERGETVAQALARELHEELGLDVRASEPWVVRRFVYPHAHVRLHFRRVHDYAGTPRAREGQAFGWLQPHAIDVAPLLPATVPVIGWLRLPAWLHRSAAADLGEDAFVAALGRRLAAGQLRWLLLDEPELSDARFEALFHRVRLLCTGHGVRLLIGPAHPRSFGRATGACLMAAPDASAGRPAVPVAGCRTQGAEEIARAAAEGFDLALLDGAAPSSWAEQLDEAALPTFVAMPAPVAAGTQAAALRASAPGAQSTAQAWWRTARAAGAHGLVTGREFWQDA